MGGYITPVSDAYDKPDLVNWRYRVNMCRLACADSDWIDVDHWEASQEKYVYTADTLRHFDRELNETLGGCSVEDGERLRCGQTNLIFTNAGTRTGYRVKLLTGSDLFNSFQYRDLWSDEDVCLGYQQVHTIVLTNSTAYVYNRGIWLPSSRENRLRCK